MGPASLVQKDIEENSRHKPDLASHCRVGEAGVVFAAQSDRVKILPPVI
jgi:hypothetical protein